MAMRGRGKAVLISVYIEKPRNRRLFLHKPRHSYNNVHLEPSHHDQRGQSCNGYSKKAQLLLYIQQKRATSRSTGVVSSSKSALTSPMTSNTSNQRPRTPIQAVAAKIKPKSAASCLGKWKLAVRRLLKSVFRLKRRKAIWSGSTSKKIKSLGQKVQVQKRCQSIFNTMGFLRKRK